MAPRIPFLHTAHSFFSWSDSPTTRTSVAHPLPSKRTGKELLEYSPASAFTVMSQFRQPTTVPGGRLERVHEDFERCYRAVQSKDARFDGWFVTAVSTTRIYCRPSCPARSPLARNVVFYPTAAATVSSLPTTPAALVAHSRSWQPFMAAGWFQDSSRPPSPPTASSGSRGAPMQSSICGPPRTTRSTTGRPTADQRRNHHVPDQPYPLSEHQQPHRPAHLGRPG